MFLSKNLAQDDSKEPSGVPGEETIPLSFLFIVNKLIIFDPEWDEYHNSIPPHAPHKYMGEISSKVMRYSNGQVSEAVGYHWYRDSSHAMGHLFCLDSSGNYIPDNSTDSYHMAQQYETFAVFACNPLLPLMVTDRDPLVRETRNWQLLRIFHSPRARGLSQVVTLESAMGYGGAPVRYVAGKSPSWMPALIPETYQSPNLRAPPSRGLGGELGIVLGLMALTADKSTTSNDAVNEMFIERQQWHHNKWRGPKAPRGCK
ncbi:uncharacterized protein NECHADRAFT_52413 [Fusarium vanettenii 77-13-4]|uniref:Uncharacterized protein n=1 Tax=Fusarium vanettenii (strain ATCC MYA-4622 / CBS 123669 / FGSC 9596 / NRRL 45880 / 77-13-4) TaxID=660122 RepID=C7ZK24_FUSV7|nr:uncharacterized protein NECHADRAFT_52413 [Fusarium vanettenii 77-13-4]EEU35562.1 hypothetical protein NECHADRAFT_52413 [Fusarium vanettenii 77-13-4]